MAWLGAAVFLAAAGLNPAGAQVVSALKAHDDTQPIEAKARTQVLLEDDQVAVLEGDAEIRQGKLRLNADRIVIRYENSGDGERPRVVRMEAKGHVRLESPSENVEARWGIYDVPKRLILLGGDVVLKREGNLLMGSRMEVDLDSGLIRLSAEGEDDGRVKGVFHPADKAKEETSPGRGAAEPDGGRR